jgi:hypothetical protein
MDLDQRLRRRYKLISKLEFLINESIYYRSNNCYFDDNKKITICNISQIENKAKIL